MLLKPPQKTVDKRLDRPYNIHILNETESDMNFNETAKELIRRIEFVGDLELQMLKCAILREETERQAIEAARMDCRIVEWEAYNEAIKEEFDEALRRQYSGAELEAIRLQYREAELEAYNEAIKEDYNLSLSR